MIPLTNIFEHVKSYKFNSILIKNLRLLLLLVLFPLLLLSIFGFFYYNTILEKEISITTLNAVQRVRDTIDTIISDTDKKINSIVSDDYVNLFFYVNDASLSPSNKIQRANNIQRLMNSYILSSDYIDSIYIYSEVNDYILSSRGSNVPKRFNDNEWIDKYNINRNIFDYCVYTRQLNYIFDNNNIHYFISVLKASQTYNQKNGIVVVNIDIKKLNSLMNNIIGLVADDFFIINDKDEIVYSNNYELLNKKYKDIPHITNVNLDTLNSPVFYKSNGINKVMTSVNSKYNNWTFVSIVPIKHYENNIYYVKSFIFIMLLLVFIITIVLSFVISIKIYQPINNIVSVIENPDEWVNLNTKKSIRNSDEYSYITQNVLKTYVSNKQMEEKLVNHLSLLKKAQTIALQSQINPHFLFNTLGAIKLMTMSLTKGENHASIMIALLADLFMLSMDTKDHLVPIKKEIQHANTYIKLLQIRYKNKFEVVWDIDEIISENMIVKLSFQPLIENAIYHGIKPLRSKGIITIKGYIHKEFVVIELTDNGVGMTTETVNSLNRSLSEDYIKESAHIGLSNVNQRIKLIFGDEYGITIKSELGKGTKISMIVPYTIKV